MQRIFLLIILILVLLLTGCGNSADNSAPDQKVKADPEISSGDVQKETPAVHIRKKYPLESGIITFERTGVIGNEKVTVYFADYGTKERRETIAEDGSVKELLFTDGENMYKLMTIEDGSKMAYIYGPGNFGTEMKFEPDPFRNSPERAEKYKFQKLDNIQIAGKDCEAYSTVTQTGKIIFAGWNGLHLYSKAELSIGKMETIAVDIKENADVDPELFKVPEDYKVQKI